MKQILRNLFTLAFLLSVSSMSAAAESEREPFDDRYCTTCHGADGRGNEGVQAPRLAGMEDWYLVRQLENFRAGIRGTHPKDIEGIAMQPMAVKLTDESIADIVQWVGGWTYIPAEITVEGDEARGQQLYTACAACHGQQAEGNEALGAPALAGQNDWYLVTQLKNFMADYRGHHPDDSFGQQMRTMSKTLVDESGIHNVVSYINTLAER
ncbi:MAG: c-type cytochrome [Pseudomonadales bacterium]|nr:c-type cytochrome [Pseudomonadales bacterium]